MKSTGTVIKTPRTVLSTRSPRGCFYSIEFRRSNGEGYRLPGLQPSPLYVGIALVRVPANYVAALYLSSDRNQQPCKCHDRARAGFRESHSLALIVRFFAPVSIFFSFFFFGIFFLPRILSTPTSRCDWHDWSVLSASYRRYETTCATFHTHQRTS